MEKPSLEKFRGRNGDLFEVDRRFLLILSGLITGGTLAKIGPGPIATWLVLRTHARWSTSLVSMGMAAIAHQSGQSERVIKKQITVLEREGLIEKISSSQGKRSIYKIIDPLPVFSKDDDNPEHRKEAGVLPIPYDPSSIGDVLNKLSTFAKTGIVPAELEKKGIHFQMNLNITLIKNENGGNVFINVGNEKNKIQQEYEAVLSLPEGPAKKLAINAIREQLDRLEKE